MEVKSNETKIGGIPDNWEVVRLGDVSLGFVSGGTPSTKNPAYWNGDIPWMTSAHINGRTVTQGVKCITEEGLKNSATNVVPKNNILIATRVGIGKVAVNLVDMTISQDLTGVVLDHKKVNVDFIYWLLSNHTSKLKSLAQGSTIKGLLRKEIENLKLPRPSLPEQHRIAEILTTADTAIRKVDDAIAKTEWLKRGLMQELLTKGIGHEEFEDSEVGRIPRGWEVVKLGSIAKLESGGTPSRQKSEYWENGTIPWVKSGELNDGVIYETEEKITELGLKKSSAKLFSKETLFMALYGRGTVSKTAILGIDAATNQAIGAIIPANSSFDSKFMQHYLIFSRNKLLSQVVNPSTDVGRTNIYLGSLKLFKLPLPSPPEQHRIAEILSTVDKKIELERKRKEKLEKIKKGLMNELLTGKKRVTIAR
jgi:type I restriction enzyme S subunit